uniref:Uncharacterized protein n=1 Tax=Anguilla anguilla TaxID=7936 RepID=A0A0E9VBH4_ANGAN
MNIFSTVIHRTKTTTYRTNLI